MNKKLLILLILFFNFYLSQAQCAYTGTPLTSVGTFTFCIDSGNTLTTPTVASGQFALVNVVQGFRYSFTVGNVFSGQENLTILNAANNVSFGPGSFNSGGSGASIVNWTSTISGQIKVLLSSGSCSNDNTVGGPLTLTLLAVGNTQDDQTSFGTNNWEGHVYNYAGGGSPGGFPSPNPLSTTTSPFVGANYVGNYNIITENFNETFGSSNACFPILSGGVNRVNMFAESFAVRYRMRSTKPAGCYVLNVNGDDGVRVYVDGALVFDRWVEQGDTSYCNNLINLTGNSTIVLDYYENAGQNVVGFSLTPFDGSGNAITSSTDVRVCSNIASPITASNLITCNSNTNTVYQWQISTNNITFTNISGANAQNYTVPGLTIAAGAANNLRYFRRVFKPSTLTAGACEFFSNVVTVTTSGAVPSAPSAVSGSQNQCKTSLGTFSVTPVTNAVSYNWSTAATGWTITPSSNGLTATVSFNSAATSGDLQVSATNGCGTSVNFLYPIQVRDLPTSATISGTASVCVGAAAPVVAISNPQAYNVNVTYNINGGTNVVVLVGANASVNFPVSTSTTGTFIYNLVNVSNPSSPNCSTNLSGSATVTVGAVTGDQVSYGTNSWIGYVYPSANPENSNFSTNFVGSISQVETFDLNLDNAPISGTGICGSYADNFAVRFKMNRNLPAGCYTFTVGGDDGYRLSLDGGLTYVVNNWGDHSYQETTYAVYLNGNTNFVLEYFESRGQSRVRFSSVFSSLLTPTLGTVNHPNCAVTTGSIPLSGLPSSGTWTIIANPNTAGLTGLTGIGGTTTVGGLIAGTTYIFAVSNGTCTSPISSNVLINPLPLVATYNGTWTNGPPTIEQSIVFAGNYTSIANLEGCDCTVNSGVKVTVKSNHVLKITNAVKVNTAAGTSLTFQNNASLVQINNVANLGNIIYERITAPLKKYDYTYWSSPVLNQKLIDVSPDTDYDKFYSFNAAIDNWKQENPQDFMQTGIGYIIRAPENIAAPPTPPGLYQASFVGVPFNGPLSITGIIRDRSYLLGNPYPSALNADMFLNGNSSVLDGTLYFWTHNTTIGIGVSNPGSGVYAYSSDDYATYNLTGGVGTGTGNTINNVEQTINKPTGKIAAGQAFFTSSKLSPTGTVIDFNNSMRLDVNGAILNNDQFFKVKNATKKTNILERNRVWLNLTNTQGAFKQMLVGYVTNATDGFDSSFDGPSYNGNDFIDFYSISGDVAMTIQGRILPFDENDIVPLGYSSVIEGVFSISIDEVDGVFASQNIYLEDKFNNSIHDLKKAAYNFETATGTFDDRFVLRYTDKKLGVGDFVTTVTEVLVSVKNKRIKINSSVESIDKVFIYDMLGKKLYEKINVENKELVIPNLGSSEQFLIVKTVLQNGKVVTAKTIY